LHFLKYEFVKNHKRLEDVYIGLIARELKTPIRNYAERYLFNRNGAKEAKTLHLSRIKVTDLYFLYEANHFSHFWDVFVSNGSNLITTTKPTTTSKTTTTTTISQLLPLKKY
jgi:hypothetical protein